MEFLFAKTYELNTELGRKSDLVLKNKRLPRLYVTFLQERLQCSKDFSLN